MFESDKSAGYNYTTMIALLFLAFVFIPVVLVASHSFGYLALFLGSACSVICVAVAWLHWKMSSKRLRPAAAIQDSAHK